MPTVSMTADQRPDMYPYKPALQGQDYMSSTHCLLFHVARQLVEVEKREVERERDTERKQPHIQSIHLSLNLLNETDSLKF